MMKRTTLALGLVSLLAGCNSLGGVPEFKAGGIVPTELHPGDTALITIEVKDKNGIVHAVTGVVKEEPSLQLKLRDDGQEGDVAAADGTWSLAVTVPPIAPAGAFNVTFTAYRKDGVPVPIRGEAGSIHPLALELPMIITLKP
jgi:hypothetical protein